MNDSPPDVSTGFLAFVAFVVLALALWFLMRNMNARMRRMSYRQQAAHRGKDEPQAGPDEVAAQAPRRDEQDAPPVSSTDADGAVAPERPEDPERPVAPERPEDPERPAG
ncbi:hypothetical protein [Phycicoccus sp.]|uniref:hypothetical protein n=1 Tax=Phycicoccus sp. TaxID=1902410 RepID=UPI002CBB3C9F|nr:hypothetical protein [Phycicoccus sp.]HMM93495.1 hypothetical protein [Phycicoccus sp.]